MLVDESESWTELDDISSESADEDQADEVFDYTLEEDMWTYLWYSCQRGGCLLVSGCHATLGAFALGALQVFIAAGIGVSLRRATFGELRGYTTLYEDVVEKLRDPGFRRLTPVDSEKICGIFGDNYEDGNFSYVKLPLKTWDPFALVEGDRSALDTVMMASEIYSIYSAMVVLLAFLFNVVILTELFSIRDFWLFICEAPIRATHNDDDDEQELQPLLAANTSKSIQAINATAKFFGYIICTIRFIVAGVLAYVGWMLFFYTTSLIDLILNSLGLAFILDIDKILYSGIVTKQGQHGLVRNVQATFLRTYPLCGSTTRKCSSALAPYGVILLSTLAGIILRTLQSHALKKKFNLFATMCLFLGPSPHINVAYPAVFPIPGFCESLLECKCRVLDDWLEQQCLNKPRIADSPCESYAINASQYCNCRNTTDDLPAAATILVNSCRSLLQISPSLKLQQGPRPSWVGQLQRETHPRPPHYPAIEKYFGFPRTRDVDAASFLFAGPFACSLTKISELLPGNLERIEVLKALDSKSAQQILQSCSAGAIPSETRGLQGEYCESHVDCHDGFCSLDNKCDSGGCRWCGNRDHDGCSKGIGNTCSLKCDKRMTCANVKRIGTPSYAMQKNCTRHLDSSSGEWFYEFGGRVSWESCLAISTPVEYSGPINGYTVGYFSDDVFYAGDMTVHEAQVSCALDKNCSGFWYMLDKTPLTARFGIGLTRGCDLYKISRHVQAYKRLDVC